MASICRLPTPLKQSRQRLLDVLLAALAPTAVAMATPVSAEPAGTAPPLGPTPLWPELSTVLALPPWLHLDLDLNAEPMGGNGPPLGSSGAWIQQLTLTAEASRGLGRDKTQWQEFDHWKTSLQLTAFSGNANLNETLGTVFPLQTAAHPVGLWLTEASVQRVAAGDPVFFKAGLMPLNPSFVESDVLNSYIHSALNNTLNLEINGLPINPFIAPAATVHVRLGSSSELRIGQFWLDNVNNLASLFGVNPQMPLSNGSLQIVQWNLRDLPGSAQLQQPIQQGERLVSRQLPQPLLQLGALNTTGTDPNLAAYGTLTVAVPVPIGLDHRVWIGFNNGFTIENDPDPTFVGGGWLAQGLLPGRPLDVLAVGYGSTWFNSTLAPGLNPEMVLEINYTISLSSQFTLQPVLQWIVNPNGSNNRPAVVAAGLQLNLSF
ncbi:MAG: Carbohydrate-selective porin OprB related protein [Cyanobacteriota bacterium]|jgi:porin